MELTELATIYYQTNNEYEVQLNWKKNNVLNQRKYCSSYEKDFQDKCHIM